MSLEKQYQPQQIEPALDERWQAQGTYHFDPDSPQEIFSVDSPPPTVSGKMHIGHLYSYSHPDFIVRFQRMRGKNIFYPMGFDDNGLPTERLVEKTRGIRVQEVGREAFIQACLEISEQVEVDYRKILRRLGLSVDWRQTYRSIDAHSRRCAQQSFLDLYQKGLVYRAKAPAIWCSECRASFAQADQEDRTRWSEFVTLPFTRPNGEILEIATTRPELLAACVAVFVHPADARYQGLIGEQVTVPLYGQSVAVLADLGADPEKGTGAVMCCTFGDQADVAWQRAHHLPVIEAIDETGRMTAQTRIPGIAAGDALVGLAVEAARKKIKEILASRELILRREAVEQTIRVHERCGTPLEYRVVAQWFIKVLENKARFLELGEQLHWRPDFMHARYKAWVENLNWDWSVSRQRAFGVSFPAWFCKACGETILAGEADLPVDPLAQQPSQPCRCGSTDFIPDPDVMDTWATSSVSAQVVTGWLDDPEKFTRLFPLTLRPQAHEIIRTWTFYSIVKSWYHFGCLPWREVQISGWGIAGPGQEKISKSKGGGPVAPWALIEKYSADALRYWASSAASGRDAIISDDKYQAGMKLAVKLWNVARFAEPFLEDAPAAPGVRGRDFTSGDRWILARCARLVDRVTAHFEGYDYAAARGETEEFFWRDLADNYLEMAKLRLYDAAHPAHAGACVTLKTILRVVLKLFAPILPYVTEAIWLELYSAKEGGGSIHRSAWPGTDSLWSGESAELLVNGETLLAIATAARRYKSEHALSLGTELSCLAVAVEEEALAQFLTLARPDLTGITRAKEVVIGRTLAQGMAEMSVDGVGLRIGILR